MTRPVAGFDMDGVLSDFIGPYQILGSLIQEARAARACNLPADDCAYILRTALSPALTRLLSDPVDYYKWHVYRDV